MASKYLPTIGGGEYNTHGILRELAKRHEVTLLTPQRVAGPRYEVIDRVPVKRFWNRYNPLHRLPYSSGPTQCPMIFSELVRESYDAILGFPAMSGDVKLALWAKKIKNTPVFLVVYDLMDYARYNPSKFRLKEILEKFWSPPRHLRRGYGSLDGIFTIVPEQIPYLAAMNQKTSFVPCGVDLNEFDSSLTGFRTKHGIGNKPLVLCLGRICEHKGQDMLIRALPEVKKRVAKLVTAFVGPFDSPTYAREVDRLIAELGLSDSVIFTGPLPRDEVIMAMNECDVNVCPGQLINWLAVLETWAARKPVLQSDWHLPRIVEDGIDGFTFTRSDRLDLVDKLCKVLEDKGKRQRMGESGRRKVESEYTFSNIASRIEEHLFPKNTREDQNQRVPKTPVGAI